MKDANENTPEYSNTGVVPVALLKPKACFLAAANDVDKFNAMCNEALGNKLLPISEYVAQHVNEETYFLMTFMTFDDKEDSAIQILSNTITHSLLICESDIDKFNKKVAKAIKEGYGFKMQIVTKRIVKLNMAKEIQVPVGGFPETKVINQKLHYLYYGVKYDKSVIQVFSQMPEGTAGSIRMK